MKIITYFHLHHIPYNHHHFNIICFFVFGIFIAVDAISVPFFVFISVSVDADVDADIYVYVAVYVAVNVYVDFYVAFFVTYVVYYVSFTSDILSLAAYISITFFRVVVVVVVVGAVIFLFVVVFGVGVI